MLATFLLASSLTVTPVQFSDVTFSSNHGDILPGTAVMPVHHSGVIRGRVEVQSNRLDSGGPAYLPPDLSIAWRLSSGSGISQTRPGTSWYGTRIPGDRVFVIDFDPNTGIADLEVGIPIGHADGPQFPRLAQGGNSLEVKLGWTDTLGLDAQHEPRGFGWEGSLLLTAEVDPVSVQAERTLLFLGAEAQGLIRIEDTSAVDRTFEVRSSEPRLASIASPFVVVPAGRDHATFTFTATDSAEGQFRLRVLEGGVQVATSEESKITAGSLSSTSLPLPDTGENEWEFDRVCVPAGVWGRVAAGTDFNTCSGCHVVPVINCPTDTVPTTSGYCKKLKESACLMGGNKTVVGPKFSKVDTYGEDCVLPLLTKICCRYTKSPETMPVSVPSCI